MGVTWKTANRWFHAGQIPGAYQVPSGTIIVPDEEDKKDEHDASAGETIIYARVSNASRRKTDLETQAQRLVDYSNARGWSVDRIVKETGSGLNDNRPKLEAILTSSKPVARIVFEHKDRLTRFGYRYLELLARQRGTDLICVNPAVDDKDDLLQDLTSIITSFCARIYGQRSGKRKTERIMDDLRRTD
jgi:predicted site-specific integrase-resolvase